MKLKAMFSTPKKTVISIICITVLLFTIGSVGVYAVSAIAESSAIGSENACNFAFADSKIDPAEATVEKTEFKYKHGQFVYEIEFTYEGKEYEYTVRSSDGEIIKKEVEVEDKRGGTTKAQAALTTDKAVETALNDAGLTRGDVKLQKTKLDIEDSVSVYDVEFVYDGTEYEYEINASTGEIYEKKLEKVKTPENPKKQLVSGEEAKETALNDSMLNTESIIASNTVLHNDVKNNFYIVMFVTDTKKYTYHINAESGKIVYKEVKNKEDAPTDGSSEADNAVTVEEAVAISLIDAKIRKEDTVSIETKVDNDDGISVYKIEFQTNINKYGYKINANSGEIIEKESEAIVYPHENPQKTVIALEKAKELALSSADLSAESVTFTKAKLEKEHGVTVYEIEFFTSTHEYEFVLNAYSGEILEKSLEAIRHGSEISEPMITTFISSENAKSIALNDAGVSNAAVTKAKLDIDEGRAVYEIEFKHGTIVFEYEIDASSGEIVEKTFEEKHASEDKNSKDEGKKSNTYIGVQRAKDIALKHIGVSENEAVFKKAKLDDDDGKAVYEIEFYIGRTEYEFEIDAVSGRIIEYDIDED